MAQKPESRLISSVGKLIPVGVHREKMFNPYRSGTADCWYSGDRADLWVEWKWVQKFGRIIKPDLSPMQLLWLVGRHREGRSVRVIVGSPDGCTILASPAEWSNGVARDGAQILSRRQTAEWITAYVAQEPAQLGVGGKGRLHNRVLCSPDVERHPSPDKEVP